MTKTGNPAYFLIFGHGRFFSTSNFLACFQRFLKLKPDPNTSFHARSHRHNDILMSLPPGILEDMLAHSHGHGEPSSALYNDGIHRRYYYRHIFPMFYSRSDECETITNTAVLGTTNVDSVPPLNASTTDMQTAPMVITGRPPVIESLPEPYETSTTFTFSCKYIS